MRRSFFLLLGLLGSWAAQAQDDLFGAKSSEVRPAFLFGVHAGIDAPAADMSKRYGSSYRVGGSMQYRLRSNWQFGFKGDFLFGNTIREDSSLINLRDVAGFFLDDNGVRTGASVTERGYQLGVVGGKMLPFSRTNPNRGLLLQLSAGFVQHKISFFNQQSSLAQLRDGYQKGYDRLTNGLFVEPYVAYQHFSQSGFVNFHLGVGAMVGFTAGRRDYQFDLQRPDRDGRLDVLVGLRAGWYFAFSKKRSEEIFFE